jgi:TIR domain
MAGKIFINYRRGDDPGATGWLRQLLEDAFSADQLFMDIDSIAPGLDFVRVLEDEVDKCDVFLAVIGPRWFGDMNAEGTRRLDNPEDFVRIEIESALKLGKRIIPVLVGNANVPRSEQLPESLKPLTRRHAVRLTHERFASDAEGLIKQLERVIEEVEAEKGIVWRWKLRGKRLLINIGTVLIVLVGIAALYPSEIGTLIHTLLVPKPQPAYPTPETKNTVDTTPARQPQPIYPSDQTTAAPSPVGEQQTFTPPPPIGSDAERVILETNKRFHDMVMAGNINYMADPKKVVEMLIMAWGAGDREVALKLAESSVVDEVFKHPQDAAIQVLRYNFFRSVLLPRCAVPRMPTNGLAFRLARRADRGDGGLRASIFNACFVCELHAVSNRAV